MSVSRLLFFRLLLVSHILFSNLCAAFCFYVVAASEGGEAGDTPLVKGFFYKSRMLCAILTRLCPRLPNFLIYFLQSNDFLKLLLHIRNLNESFRKLHLWVNRFRSSPFLTFQSLLEIKFTLFSFPKGVFFTRLFLQ